MLYQWNLYNDLAYVSSMWMMLGHQKDFRSSLGLRKWVLRNFLFLLLEWKKKSKSLHFQSLNYQNTFCSRLLWEWLKVLYLPNRIKPNLYNIIIANIFICRKLNYKRLALCRTKSKIKFCSVDLHSKFCSLGVHIFTNYSSEHDKNDTQSNFFLWNELWTVLSKFTDVLCW